MSVSISAVPVLLIASLISTSITAIDKAIDRKREFDEIAQRLKIDAQNGSNVSEEIINQICREYDTVFLDKDVLMKTLDEYGFDDVEDQGDQIVCRMEGFVINFYKNPKYGSGEAETYKMFIKTECDDAKIEELIGDISEQYTSNTQEESYKKIKERLKKHNLEISEEEVLDDNSIVITVDIE